MSLLWSTQRIVKLANDCVPNFSIPNCSFRYRLRECRTNAARALSRRYSFFLIDHLPLLIFFLASLFLLCLPSIDLDKITIDGSMEDTEQVKSIWRNANAVTFDVDSTVIQEEGIDELAKFCGKENEVTMLTSQAMQGNVTFRQSLVERLTIIKPSITQIKQFLASHPLKLSPGIQTLITALQIRKKQVFLISGGFHCLIAPVASSLNIPSENIFANRLKFYFTGEYAGFDKNQPTAESGGKAKVIQYLKKEKGFKTIVHIGDGATDLETTSVVDLFIGYGGNVIRENVKSRSPWFITDFKELINILETQTV